MVVSKRVACVLLLLALGNAEVKGQTCGGDRYNVYYTLGAQDGMTFQLESVGPLSAGAAPSGKAKIVNVNPSDTHQSMLGFGAALTGSSAYLLHNAPNQATLLRDLFDKEDGLGINYLRVPMGGSDFQPVTPYTYNDMPAGQTDVNLDHFSTEADLDFIVPVLQNILRSYPDVLIVAVPWSAPAWMKDSKELYYGSLENSDTVLNAYAEYFVRFLQDYDGYGIPISTLSIQNEPEHEAYDYPSMSMSSEQMASLVSILGPKMESAGFSDVGILVWDHNWDNVNYPISILDDSSASQYVAGSALHCYAGDPSATQQIHDSHPDKDIYFTECSGGEWSSEWDVNLVWNTKNLFISQTRQYARNVLFWNLALDQNYGPKWDTQAGCVDCRGVVEINGGQLSVNVEGVILEQFNRYVSRGAVRVGSTEQIQGRSVRESDVSNVAFVNPNGQLVVQVVSGWEHNDPISMQVGGEYYTVDWGTIPGVGSDDHRQFAQSLITFVQIC